MNTKVLVAYATKYGATGEIAQRIGAVLSELGISSDVMDVSQVDDLTPYAAVILGSAVYAGQWRKEAASFLEAHEQDLAALPVWIFSSGPTGDGDPVELMKGWRFPETLQPIAERVKPRDIAFFGGNIDMEKLNLAERLIVKGVKAPPGDYRDWDVIETWAKGIGQEIKSRG